MKLIGRVIKSQKGAIQYTKKGQAFVLLAPLMVSLDKRPEFKITLDNGETISSKDFDPTKHSLFAVPLFGDIVDAFREEAEDDMKLQFNKPYCFVVDQRVSTGVGQDGSRTKWVQVTHPNDVEELFALTGDSMDTLPHLPLMAALMDTSDVASPADQAKKATEAAKLRAQLLAQEAAKTSNSVPTEQPAEQTA